MIRQRSIALFVAACCAGSGCATTSNREGTRNDAAGAFMQCAGLYRAVASYLDSRQSTNARVYRGMSSSAFLVSLRLAREAAPGMFDGRALEAIALDHERYWQSILTEHGISRAARDELGQCVELIRLQVRDLPPAPEQRIAPDELPPRQKLPGGPFARYRPANAVAIG